MAKVIVRKSAFTAISNEALQCTQKLSFKAIGLLSYMLSLPDDWDYTIEGLASISCDGKCAIRSAIIELEKTGFLKRNMFRNNQGLYECQYFLSDTPGKFENDNKIANTTDIKINLSNDLTNSNRVRFSDTDNPRRIIAHKQKNLLQDSKINKITKQKKERDKEKISLELIKNLVIDLKLSNTSAEAFYHYYKMRNFKANKVDLTNLDNLTACLKLWDTRQIDFNNSKNKLSAQKKEVEPWLDNFIEQFNKSWT